MTLEHINPPNLVKATGYSHMVVAPSGGRTIYLSGKTGHDANRKLIGPGDHFAQTKQAFRNVGQVSVGRNAVPTAPT